MNITWITKRENSMGSDMYIYIYTILWIWYEWGIYTEYNRIYCQTTLSVQYLFMHTVYVGILCTKFRPACDFRSDTFVIPLFPQIPCFWHQWHVFFGGVIFCCLPVIGCWFNWQRRHCTIKQQHYPISSGVTVHFSCFLLKMKCH